MHPGQIRNNFGALRVLLLVQLFAADLLKVALACAFWKPWLNKVEYFSYPITDHVFIYTKTPMKAISNVFSTVINTAYDWNIIFTGR